MVKSKKRGAMVFTFVAGTAAIAAVAAVLLVGRGHDGAAARATGLPNTPDYHSLLVSPTNPDELVLGTHSGLFRSSDGGRTWRAAGADGSDAMNLARTSAATWLAGHDVLMKSTDGGRSWHDVEPTGLPGLDVHGFAVDPRNPQHVWAAIAGQGLYRSGDGGASFELVSTEVGGGVMALAVSSDGRLLAGDMQRGLLQSRDGRSWKVLLRAQLAGLAIDPRDPRRILAAGPGVLLSTDGGVKWRQTLRLDQGAGPVAWAPSDPGRAYVVGFDRTLYTTGDGGSSWRLVAGGE